MFEKLLIQFIFSAANAD